jgi:hypothetical protein
MESLAASGRRLERPPITDGGHLMSDPSGWRRPDETTSRDRDSLLETFAAELTQAANGVALRHGAGERWLELQLELWLALKDTLNRSERKSPPNSEAAPASGWAERLYRAVHGDGLDVRGRRSGDLDPLSGE